MRQLLVRCLSLAALAGAIACAAEGAARPIVRATRRPALKAPPRVAPMKTTFATKGGGKARGKPGPSRSDRVEAEGTPKE